MVSNIKARTEDISIGFNNGKTVKPVKESLE